PAGCRSAGRDRRGFDRLRWSEDRGPIVPDADDGPAIGARLRKRLVCAGRVRELALGVVVDDQQAERRLVIVLGELEHLDVAIRVAAGDDRSAPGPAPDPDRLLWSIVEVFRRGFVRDRAAPLVGGVLELRR